MFKKFSATILAVMIASTMSISVFADGVTYTGAPTEKWDFANGEFTESLNGISSAEGRGYSSKYFSAKADKIYYLELINVTASGTITFTVINKNNGMVSKTLNYDDMVHSYSPEGSGGDSFGAALEFRADNDFYFEITTSNPQSVKFSGTYTISESDLTHFNDISGHWAENTINKWADKGIISGYPDGTFKPDNSVTRAELAKILTFAFDLQPSEYVFDKREVNGNEWYYNYLIYAGKYIPNYALPEINEKNQPYVDNRTVNAFLPQQSAMRMHVAEALVEIIKSKNEMIDDVPDITVVKDELNKTFRDAEYEELFANHGMIPENVRRMFEYTYLANKLGIMQGDTDGYFRPYDNVTRAELITMLDRIMYHKLSDFIPKDIINISYQELDYPNGVWTLEKDKMNEILQIFSEIKLIPNAEIEKPFKGYSFALSSESNPTMVYIRDNGSVTIKQGDDFVEDYILSDINYVKIVKEIMESTGK